MVLVICVSLNNHCDIEIQTELSEKNEFNKKRSVGVLRIIGLPQIFLETKKEQKIYTIFVI